MEAFFLSVLSGIVANNLDSVGKKAYSKLKEYLGEKKVNTLIEHTKNNESKKLKNEIENILDYNEKLKQELENLQNQNSVTQNNVNGNNFYSNGNQTINNYQTKESDPKKS